MTADVTARLAEIRDRNRIGYALTINQLIAQAKTTHPFAAGPVIVQGCVVTDAAALKDAVRGVWFKDMPALVAFAEQALELADRLAADAARLRTHRDDQHLDLVVERTDRSADLQHVADEIRSLLAAALADTAKEPSRA